VHPAGERYEIGGGICLSVAVKAVRVTATCTVNRSTFGLPLFCPRLLKREHLASHETLGSCPTQEDELESYLHS
jgi:hypothetical protein